MRHAKECASTVAASLIVGAVTTASLVVTSTNASATPEHRATPDVYRQATQAPDGHTATRTAAPIAPTLIDVAIGDTLSGLSAQHLGDAGRWTDLWNANRATVGSNPNLIYPGQSLAIPAGHVPPPAELAVAPVAAPAYTAPTRHVPIAAPAPPRPVVPSHVNPGYYGGFQACVIQRESGGNPRAVNPSSGAGGLYQFLPSTWRGLGFSGLPQNASVSEQNAAFAKEFAASGTSAWRAYDGC